MLAFSRFFLLLFSVLLVNCADDRPYMQGYIKRAADAIMTSCDPYNKGDVHTCVVFASAFSQHLVIFDATAEELVLGPNPYFPLFVKVGPLTNRLAKVMNTDKKFPYFLALDQGMPAIFAVPAFASADGKQESFASVEAQQLPKEAHKPQQIASWYASPHIMALLTYPDDASVLLVALDAATGKIDPTIAPKRIALGVKPSHVVVDAQESMALISDEGSNYIHRFDLSNIKNVMTGTKPTISTIDIGAPSDRIYLSARDFGAGMKNYLAAVKAHGSELRLINISDGKLETKIALKEKQYAQVAYFPDAKSEPCCGGEPNWLAVATIGGKLYHYVVKYAGGSLKLQEASNQPVDLTTEKNLALSQLQLAKIIGGKVEFDPSLGREQSCPNNRKMFFIASWGSDRPRYWTSAESLEVEAQGYSCEGEGTATRFGLKRE